jgi:hypothetical protein
MQWGIKRMDYKKIGCLIYADAENEDKMSGMLKMGSWAANSFKYFHPDIELIAVTFWELGGAHNNLKSDTPFKNIRERCPDTYDWHMKTYSEHNRQQNIWGINKFKIAEELIRREEFDKLIVLGADTITCARLDHFLQAYPCFNCKFTDTDVIITPDVNEQFPANPDVICFNARETAEGMRSKALTIIVDQWDKDYVTPDNVGHALKYGEMWTLKKVLSTGYAHGEAELMPAVGSKYYINRMPVPNVHYSYNANKDVDVRVGEDFELINVNEADPVKKLYVFHIQAGLGTKETASIMYTIFNDAIWKLPIFNIEIQPEKGMKNREFFKTVTGDDDMFDLKVEPGLSTERAVGTVSGNAT